MSSLTVKVYYVLDPYTIAGAWLKRRTSGISHETDGPERSILVTIKESAELTPNEK